MTILVVDEDSSCGRLVNTALAVTGKYSVILAEDGREALAILGAERDIKLVITSFRVPGSSGAEIVRRAKELIPGVKVLVLVSEERDFVWRMTKAVGAEAVLRRPFSISGLREEVQKLVG